MKSVSTGNVAVCVDEMLAPLSRACITLVALSFRVLSYPLDSLAYSAIIALNGDVFQALDTSALSIDRLCELLVCTYY